MRLQEKLAMQVMSAPEKEPHDRSCGVNFTRYSDNGCEMVSTKEQEPAPQVLAD